MDLPARTDIAVVGGGLAGLATAWALGDRGVRDVVLLERDAALAGHASARNAAMCRSLAEDDAWTRWTAEGAGFLRRPPPGFSDAPLVDDRGAILLAGAAVAAELAARAARFELRATPVTAAEVAARWPAIGAASDGLYFPDDGCIDLPALVAAYARGAQAAGARLCRSAAVDAIVPHADGVALATARGTIIARTVVITAGAWAGELGAQAGARATFESRRRHVFALAAAAATAAPIVWNVDGDEWYARPAGDEVWTSACDSDAVAPGVVDIRDGAESETRARLPAPLAAAPLARGWACQRTFAARGEPLVGWDPALPWLFWVAGLGGHGVTASAAIGRAAAALLAR